MRTRSFLFFCALAFFGLIPGSERSSEAAGGAATLGAGGAVAGVRATADGDDTAQGLRFHLSEGAPEATAGAVPRAAAADPLDADETDTVLLRLPQLEPEIGDEQDFAMREDSLPPPRAGDTLETPFPPPVKPDAPETPEAGPLTVVRRAPEGDVPLAPHLSVTFSQPMVAVTSHSDLAAGDLPVRLSPRPAGTWRWLGTRTLLFEPDGRFPMATEFEATVPAGTRSATGAVTAEEVRWTFRTPPPQVRRTWPTGGPHVLDPVLFVSFDQRVHASAVLDSVKLKAGRKSIPLRLATEEEIAGQPEVRRLADDEQTGRWVAFRATKRLPADAELTFLVGPGTPSAEGPRETREPQTSSFRTYGAFQVERTRCGWGVECPPLVPWSVRFSNAIDETSFDASLVKIEPEIEDAAIEATGRTLTIRGPSRGRTTYTVRIDARLEDVFGQKLGDAAKLTFVVGDASPSLQMPGAPFVTLDPQAKPTLSVYSINHARLLVELYAVEPGDWPAFARYMQRHPDDDQAPGPPGRRVFSEAVATNGDPDTLTETRLDLSLALEDSYGHVVVVVSPPRDLLKKLWGGRAERRSVLRAWVQATRIGLTATVDSQEMLAWATDLGAGAPLADVELAIAPGDAATRTAIDGIGRLPLWERDPDPDVPALLVARKGLDVAILPQRLGFWGHGDGWRGRDPGESLRWFVFDDRALYRPGEEVQVKGWIRRVVERERGDLEPLGAAARDVAWRLEDSQGNEVRSGTASLSALGGFDLSLRLPDTMNLGSAWLRLEAKPGTGVGGAQYRHRFEVQEFRRPEFEVTASTDGGPHVVGAHAIVSVAANYYAGGGLPNAEVTWSVTARPTQFTPPGRGDYTFGTWTPWWKAPARGRGPSRTATRRGLTDAGGRHDLRIDFPSVTPPVPTSVEASATVMDVNRQAWTATARLLVHPADRYVGLRTTRTFVDPGEPVEVLTIVTDLDGAPVAGRPVTVEAVRRQWLRKKGRWDEKDAEPERCEVISAAAPVACRFTPKKGGRYRVTAVTVDEQDRPNRSEITVWVAGGERPPGRKLAHEAVELVPDRERYQPGDVAEVLVLAPFYPAEGVLTLRRSGVVVVERFRMDGPSFVLRVPIEDGFVPNVHVAVELVGAAERLGPNGRPAKGAPPRPAYGGGSINLSVPPLRRTLTLEARPRDARVEPGAETTVDVRLKDAAGRPVQNGEVAVVVVDEAVLALTGYRIADPIDVFYPRRPAGGHDYHLRDSVQLADMEDVTDTLGALQREEGGRDKLLKSAARPEPAPGKKPMDSGAEPDAPGGGDGDGGRPIALRQDFRALAVFAPAVKTDAEGRASVPVELPDNLTRYRVMAVAVSGARQFGSAEATITARLPLMVRPSAPRFLNYGDHFELPVVVQNQTDAPLPVSVAVRATNAVVAAPTGVRVTVPPNDRVEVRFPVDAAHAGTARFQIAAAAGPHADAATVELPIWTPATTEAFATYGTVDEDAVVAQPIRSPSDAIEEFGGLDVTTSSTALQALTDAVVYLVDYPFECSEQIASRVLAIAALRDVLDAFEAEGLPGPETLQAAVDRDIERLRALQNADGGFAFWRRGDPSWPWLSVHAAHALARASHKGFAVPEAMIEASKRYLRDVDDHIPARYDAGARQVIRAYALHVRRIFGDPDPKAAQALVREAGADALPLEAAGFVLPLLASTPDATPDAEALLRAIDNRVTQTAEAAHFVTQYEDGAYLLLHSDRRVDGILLEALVEVRPNHDLVPKLVAGLLAHRKRGRWANTQENTFVLLALDRYFAEYERQPPAFVARIWLGNRFVAEHAFAGYSTERRSVAIPMRYVANADGPQNLVIAKEGAGRMYYRVGMRYAPRDLALAAADHGFAVERTYEAVDDPSEVRLGEDGAWHVKAGARVRVRLRMVVQERRYHVALVDPLPAGLEALNPALAVTGPLPADAAEEARGGPWWWWTRTWYEHQNLRDERAEAFASLVWPGVHTYSYVARATTPGRFVVPPPKAEEMYAPETFGRGTSARLFVE